MIFDSIELDATKLKADVTLKDDVEIRRLDVSAGNGPSDRFMSFRDQNGGYIVFNADVVKSIRLYEGES